MDALIVITLVLLVIAAAVVFISSVARRGAERNVGRLAGETASRDKKARKLAAKADPVPAGRMLERAAVIERVGTSVVPAASSSPTVWTAPDPDQIGVSRRQFLNRSLTGLFAANIATFGAVSMVAFLWPTKAGGFGSKIKMGKVSDLKAQIEKGNGFLYKPEARAWLTEYPDTALAKAERQYSPDELVGMKAGLIALYQKCPHLGCRVPSCATSQWFECPCHGSQYNQVGEKKGGPAPRGMDRFGMEVVGDEFVVNTGMIIQGPPIGTNTTGQEAEGPHCIGGTTHH